MRNLISGIVGIILGSLILLGILLRGGIQGDGAYRMGGYVGLGFGVVFLVAGVVYVIIGAREENQPKKRKKPRKKRRRNEDEDEE